jgi:hypothetical protein
LGAHDTQEPEPGAVELLASKIIVHPDWNRERVANDIALVKLNFPIEYSQQIVPICLIDSSCDNFFPGQLAWATGFGLKSRPSSSQGLDEAGVGLMQIELEIIAESECKQFARFLQASAVEYKTQICAGNLNSSLTSCQGLL